MSEAFKYEMSHNIMHANSKEEGSLLEKRKFLGKSINLISEVEYDLSDSDEEELRGSKSMKLPRRPLTMKIMPTYSKEFP